MNEPSSDDTRPAPDPLVQPNSEQPGITECSIAHSHFMPKRKNWFYPLAEVQPRRAMFYFWEFIRRSLVWIGAIVEDEKEWRDIKTKVVAAVLAAIVISAAVDVWRGTPYLRAAYRYVIPYPLPASDRAASFSILVAQLEGDNDGSQTRHILTALRRALNDAGKRGIIQIEPTGRTLALDNSSDVFKAQKKAEKEGRQWLAQSKFDLLVWGYVVSDDHVLQLFFLNKDEMPTAKIASDKTGEQLGNAELLWSLDKNYELTSRLELPIDFNEDIGDSIALGAATHMLRAFLSARPGVFPSNESLRKLTAELKRVYPRFKSLAEIELPGNDKARCSILYMKGLISQFLGDQTDDLEMVNEGIASFRSTAQSCSFGVAVNPILKLTLGAALIEAGKKQKNKAYLEEAIEIFRKADGVTNFSAIPGPADLWNFLLIKPALGGALQALGEITRDRKYLDEAISIYKKSASSLDSALKTSLPENPSSKLEASFLSFQLLIFDIPLASSLISLGDLTKDSQYYEQAVAALQKSIGAVGEFRKVLTGPISNSFNSELAPYLGDGLNPKIAAYLAEMNGDLAETFVKLSRSKKDIALLDRAILAFAEALKSSNKEENVGYWAWLQNNLGLALDRVGRERR